MDAADEFAGLYARHRAEVFRYLFARLQRRELAEDLTHDVFVGALKRLDTFIDDGRGHVPWLMRIAHNAYADYCKSAWNRREVGGWQYLEDDTGAWGETPDDPSVIAERSLVQRQALAVLRCLSAAQSRCLALRYLAGLSIDETAREMGMTKGSIKQMTLRATRTARRRLEGAGL